ncbi:MAG: ABC transporter permease subunit [Pseudomonadota bacterium]
MINIARSVIAVLVAASLIELVVRLSRVPEYLFPAPSAVVIWGYNNISTLISDLGITGTESIAGLLIAAVLAQLTFLLFGSLERARAFISKGASSIQAVPILAVAPFLSTWFGPGIVGKIIASALVCGPVIFAALYGAADSVPSDERAFAWRVYKTRWRYTRKFLLRRCLPGFLGGLRTSAPLAVLGAIVGEFVGSSSGLGFRILSGSYYLKTSQMMAAIVTCVILGLTLRACVRILEDRFSFWGDKRV